MLFHCRRELFFLSISCTYVSALLPPLFPPLISFFFLPFLCVHIFRGTCKWNAIPQAPFLPSPGTPNVASAVASLDPSLQHLCLCSGPGPDLGVHCGGVDAVRGQGYDGPQARRHEHHGRRLQQHHGYHAEHREASSCLVSAQRGTAVELCDDRVWGVAGAGQGTEHGAAEPGPGALSRPPTFPFHSRHQICKSYHMRKMNSICLFTETHSFASNVGLAQVRPCPLLTST